MFRWAAGIHFVIGILAVPAAAGAPEEDTVSAATAREIIVTTVFDNYAIDARLATRWGFAAVVSTPHHTVLFDTGSDGATLLSNMAKLQIDPTGIRQVVISHIHADHIGGLDDFLRANAKVQVFIPRSFPDHVRQMIESAGARHKDVSAPTGIAPGISTTGPLGQSLQEQALVVKTSEGLVVITGCAHPGIVSVVRKAQAMSPKADIALWAAFTCFRLYPDRPMKSFALSVSSASSVLTPHCTGDLARSRFREAYGPNYVEGGVGMVLRFAVPQIPAP